MSYICRSKAEPPRQSPGACHHARMCAERQRLVTAWWTWLSSNPQPGDVALELAGMQSAVRQLAEMAANADGA
jgi:hypothetical protein